MKAIVVSEYGPPAVLTLKDVADPHPSTHQVVVEIEAAGVNYVETLRRAGQMFVRGSVSLPYTPGNEIGGRIIEIGSSVDPELLGETVVSQTGGTGGYAERIALDANIVIPVPERLEMRDALALLAQGRAALGVRNEAEIVAGDRVLITAAGGGVGLLLVQLARNAGAGQIIAAARGERKLDLARQFGADVTVDYGNPDWIDKVREATQGKGVNVALDAVGGEVGRGAFDLLTNGGGRFVGYGISSGEVTTITLQEIFSRSVRVLGYGSAPGNGLESIPQLIGEALREAAAGRLRPVIGQTFPLEQAADAHRAIESRNTVGKTLLIP